jgi:hypothetical protein
MHCAGAALAVVTAFFGAGQMQPFPQRVEQSGSQVETGQCVFFAVDAQRNRTGSRSRGGFLGLRSDCRSRHSQRSGAGQQPRCS